MSPQQQPESRYSGAARDLMDLGFGSASLRLEAVADREFAYMWTGLADAMDELKRGPRLRLLRGGAA